MSYSGGVAMSERSAISMGKTSAISVGKGSGVTVGERSGDGVCDGGSNDGCSMSYYWSGMSVHGVFAYDSVESTVVISSIVNGALGTIGFQEGVLSDYIASNTGLVLALNISGVGV